MDPSCIVYVKKICVLITRKYFLYTMGTGNINAKVWFQAAQFCSNEGPCGIIIKQESSVTLFVEKSK